MAFNNLPSACINAVAQLLIEKMVYDPQFNCYALPEENSFITLPKVMVEICKKEFEAQSANQQAA